MDDRLAFKTPRVESEWLSGHLHPLAAALAIEAAHFSTLSWGIPLTLTCIYRTPEEDASYSGHSVHVLWRAWDASVKALTHDQATTLVAALNDRWIYDPNRPDMRVALFEDKAAGGSHLHGQAHPFTRMK